MIAQPVVWPHLAALLRVDHAILQQRECEQMSRRDWLCHAVIRYPGGEREAVMLAARR
jgi:hypothetical protein